MNDTYELAECHDDVRKLLLQDEDSAYMWRFRYMSGPSLVVRATDLETAIACAHDIRKADYESFAHLRLYKSESFFALTSVHVLRVHKVDGRWTEAEFC